MNNSKLISWGANQYGQLAHIGWPVCEQCELPKACDTTGLPDDVINGLIEICGGGGHTVLLDSSGRVWACGLNNKGQCGSVITQDTIIRPWHQLDTGCLQVSHVATGWEHTLALTTEGVLLGWGSNSHGQLGSMVQKGECTFRAVQVAQDVSQISAGLRHSSWVTGNGQLKSCGHLDIKNSATSPKIPELLRAKKVACGQRHTFALIGVEEEEEGHVWGWGDNRHGQLGYDSLSVSKISHLTPVKTIENILVSELKSGWSHGAALTVDGVVLCWGRNTYGQLGTPSADQKKDLVSWPVYYAENGNPTKAVQLALGSEHTLVRLDDGTVLSCGWNEHGNCGTGDMNDLHTPQPIVKKTILIGCGSAHSFAVVRDD